MKSQIDKKDQQKVPAGNAEIPSTAVDPETPIASNEHVNTIRYQTCIRGNRR